MTYYLAIIIIGSILTGCLYHKNEQAKKQEIKNILEKYMVLDNNSTIEDHV